MRDGTVLHFIPDGTPDDRHVAVVSVAAHIEALKAVPEGFTFIARVADDLAPEPIKTPEPVTPPPAPAEPPAVVPEPVIPAVVPEPPAPNAPAPAEAPTGNVVALEDMSEDALRATYETELGRKPHHKAGIDTMIAAISAKRAENAQ